jgi:hypothetical protein
MDVDVNMLRLAVGSRCCYYNRAASGERQERI